MSWRVELRSTFSEWLLALDEDVRVDVVASLNLLMDEGPYLKRPYADTLRGSKYTNMKELRLTSNKLVLRICFAFDPERKGIVLCGGNKAGANQKLFYKRLIAAADKEYTDYLQGE